MTGQFFSGYSFVVPKCEQLISKRKQKCVHELCEKIKNGYEFKLRYVNISFNEINLQVSKILYKEGFLNSISQGDLNGIKYDPFNYDKKDKKYWLELKYFKNSPVLTKIKPISLPSRKVYVNHNDLESVLSGRQIGLLKPVLPGEVIVLNTDKGVVDAYTALKLKLDGMVLCRAF